MKIHFIGIGGIGISGLAKHLLAEGHEVSGSDVYITAITKELQGLGVRVDVPHNAFIIKDQDLVIHSAVIKPDNPEIIRANELGIKVMCRSEALTFILKDKNVYAVAGAHGKSTTTAILASIMSGSTIIGALSKALNSNTRYDGTTNTMLFEADESDESFLNTNPYCSIVTNAEPEHMEFYNYNLERFYGAYRKFLDLGQKRIICAEDKFLSEYEGDAVRLYPTRDIKDIEYKLIDNQPYTSFSLLDFGRFDVWGFGQHIAVDAALAILASVDVMNIEDIRNNLKNYQGIKKRFDIISDSKQLVVIDDYGHHPTEIRATMKSVQTYKKLREFNEIIAIWQPHKFSRTIDNLSEFKTCFDGVGMLVILPVWRAGEESIDIDFEKEFAHFNLILADKITRKDDKVILLRDDATIASLSSGLVVGFGAGDITYQIRGER